jgi:hypothetical protein
VELVKLDPDQAAASVLRRTYAQIAAPLNWQSRRTWSDAQWQQHLACQQVHPGSPGWSDQIAGMVDLTVGTRLAWELAGLHRSVSLSGS